MEIDKQKKEYSEKVIDADTRRKISRVVKSITQLKWDVRWEWDA